MKIRFSLLLIVDTLDGFVDAGGLVRQRNVPHLQAAQLSYPDSGKQRNQNPRCLPVQVHKQQQTPGAAAMWPLASGVFSFCLFLRI